MLALVPLAALYEPLDDEWPPLAEVPMEVAELDCLLPDAAVLVAEAPEESADEVRLLPTVDVPDLLGPTALDPDW